MFGELFPHCYFPIVFFWFSHIVSHFKMISGSCIHCWHFSTFDQSLKVYQKMLTLKISIKKWYVILLYLHNFENAHFFLIFFLIHHLPPFFKTRLASLFSTGRLIFSVKLNFVHCYLFSFWSHLNIPISKRLFRGFSCTLTVSVH